MDDTATNHRDAVSNLIKWHRRMYGYTEAAAIKEIRAVLTDISKHGVK